MRKNGLIRFAKWFFGIVLGLIILISLLLYVYKDDICNAVIKEVNKHLNTKVSVAQVDLAFWGSFPNLSVDFDEVFIQDTYEASTELDTLLYSEKIRFKFNPMDLWRENYTLKSVDVYPGVLKLKVNDEGFTNYNILAENKDSLDNESFDLNLEKVEFEKFRFNYINNATNQEYTTRINEMVVEGAFSESLFTAYATTDLHIISARSGNIELVSNKPANLSIGVNVNKDSNTVIIPKSTIYIAELPFDFQGEVADSSFYFNLSGQQIKIEEAANKLAMKETGNVKQFSGQGTLAFDLMVNGNNDPIQPVSVDCKFGINNGSLVDPSTGMAISKLNLNGVYSNKGGSKKEHLDLKNVSFKTKGGPFRGNLSITQFEAPVFKGSADGLLNMAVVHSIFNIDNVKSLDGTVNLHSDFKIKGVTDERGTIDYHIDRCTGSLEMNGINLQLNDDHRQFKSIKGKVFLRNNEAGLQDVTLKISNSDFRVNGVFRDIVDYFSNRGNLKANVDIQSDYIIIEELDSSTKEEKIQEERAYVMPDDIEGEVYLDVKMMKYENHTFSNLKGNMNINKRTLHFPRIAVTNGGADVHGSLTIIERTPEIFLISSQLVSKNIGFSALFKEWDNFQQDVIKSANIEGVAKANVQFEAPFDLRSGIISNAIKAQIGLQIDDGKLLNVETFNEIIESLKTSSAKHVLDKEEIDALGAKLRHMSFKQLKNTFIIRDGVLVIPEMSIESSVLNMEVSGKHTFENVVDYRFGFYLRDLRRKEYSEFGEIEDDGLGTNIFMRMYGPMDNLTIEWDKQARKQNTKEYNEQEKKDIKAMLKSEFGLYKNDTTVQEYIKENRQKEELIIQFNPVNEIDTIIEVKNPKRNTKFNRLLNKWKKEEEEKKKVEFEIDN